MTDSADNTDDDILCCSDLGDLKGITFLHWNARSLYPKFEEIVQINANSKAECCIYTETWLTENTPTSMLDMEGYNIFRQDRDVRSGKERGGGIMVYVKTRLNLSMVERHSFCSRDCEILTLRLSLINVREIYIVIIYRPPDGNVKEFVTRLDNLIAGLSNKLNIEVNLIGDVNLDLKKRNGPVKTYRDFLKRHDMFNLIRHETHYGPNDVRGSLIDHFVTNNPELYQQAGICPYDESDHYIIYASRKKFKEKQSKGLMRARRYKSLVEEVFVEDLNRHNWDMVLNEDDPSRAWDVFVRDFNCILDRHAPWRMMHFTEELPEWASRELLASCKHRDHLKKKARRTGSDADADRARRSRNQCTQFKRNLRRDYFMAAFEAAGRDSKKLWKVVKRLFGNKKKGNRISSIEGSSERLEMANTINNFFADIGPKLAENIPDSLLDIDYTFEGDRDTFKFHHVEDEDIRKILASISNNKSTGVDGIPIRFLKMNLPLTIKVLKHIVNRSLDSHIVPIGWKLACLTPLYKDGDRDCPGNYRPVSILPAASKVLEKVVHKQVSHYLETHKILSEAQFGFRKNHSTTSCILSFVNDLYLNMDMGLVTGVVFLDLKKAFDTVNHEILLRKLHMYGLDRASVLWFKDYLSGRRQHTKVNGTISGERVITCGVPQGSIPRTT